jgi:hypothetical protein
MLTECSAHRRCDHDVTMMAECRVLRGGGALGRRRLSRRASESVTVGLCGFRGGDPGDPETGRQAWGPRLLDEPAPVTRTRWTVMTPLYKNSAVL